MSDQPSFFTELKQIIIDYFEAKIRLYKVSAYEKIARVTAVFFSSIILALLFFFTIFFLSIAGGFYFGELLKSNTLGFLIIFGVYVLALIIVMIYRKKLIEKPLIDKIIEQLFHESENEKDK